MVLGFKRVEFEKMVHAEEPAARVKVYLPSSIIHYPPPPPATLFGLKAPPKSVLRQRDYDLSIPRNKCRMQLSHCLAAFVGFESSTLCVAGTNTCAKNQAHVVSRCKLFPPSYPLHLLLVPLISCAWPVIESSY
ncbi:hypothetical protein M0804_001629 [Polistes exclamans]|nr:hypothetical protein M0804_001629 [Polistes exclamans]